MSWRWKVENEWNEKIKMLKYFVCRWRGAWSLKRKRGGKISNFARVIKRDIKSADVIEKSETVGQSSSSRRGFFNNPTTLARADWFWCWEVSFWPSTLPPVSIRCPTQSLYFIHTKQHNIDSTSTTNLNEFFDAIIFTVRLKMERARISTMSTVVAQLIDVFGDKLVLYVKFWPPNHAQHIMRWWNVEAANTMGNSMKPHEFFIY